MTTNEFKLIQQAEEKGFLTATKIIPAHYLNFSVKPHIIVPKGSTLTFNSVGDLVYLHFGNTFFGTAYDQFTYCAIIYCQREQKWAQILEQEKKELTPFNLVKGRSYFMESNTIKWYVSNNSENGSKVRTGFSISVNLGYNSHSCYVANYCQFYNETSGHKHAYENLRDVKIRELTDDEGRWFSHCKDLNNFVPYDSVITKSPIIPLTEFPKSGMCWKPTIELLNYLKSRESSKSSGHSINMKDIALYQYGLVWNEHNIWTVSLSSSYKEYSIEELMRHIPSAVPDNLIGRPLTPEECHFPEKWCINITAENKDLIKEFLISKKDEYINYRDNWNPHAGSTFFYPQHNVGAYCVTGHFHKERGYTFITDQQFKKHVLTHTDKQQQIIKSSKTKKDDKENTTSATSANSCKIQRSDITIRDTTPIRGIGLKCPKIQVKIGSGHLPD